MGGPNWRGIGHYLGACHNFVLPPVSEAYFLNVGRNSMGTMRFGMITLILCLALPLSGAVTAAEPQNPRAQLSWWDRTDPSHGGRLESSRFYSFRSDLDRDELRPLADHMDTMYVEYSKRMAGLEQRTPEHLGVYVFRTQRDYLDTLRTQFGINATGSGGMFFVSPNGSGLAFFVERLPLSRIHHVMQHEGFHQFANSRFGNDLPMWVNEGLAEFFGEAVVVGRTVVIGQSTPRVIGSLKNAIENQRYIRFLDLLTMSPQQWNARVQAGDASIQYQQSWSMVQFLVYGDNQRYQAAFESYLRRINAGQDSVQAFIQAFGTSDVDEFETRWIEYAKQAQPSAFVTAMERAEFLAEGMTAAIAAGKRPQTLDELKLVLQELKFSYSTGSHGQQFVFKAEDEDLFTIPKDEQAKEPPAFELTRPKKRGLTTRERKLEESMPTPPSIVTRNLAPRSIEVIWKRQDDGQTFRYEVTAK